MKAFIMTATDFKGFLFNLFLLLAVTHALTPVLIATFGSSEYFALQTLKQTLANEKLFLSSSDKELERMIDFERGKLEFSLKMATLKAETKIMETESFIRHDFAKLNATMTLGLREKDDAFRHIREMAKIESEPKQAWIKEWTKIVDRKDKLEMYRERGVVLKQLVEKWSSGDFDRTGIITRFMSETA